ncbi:MAG TPA: hypothetical protein VGO04_03670 [Ensifer sp.]|jgi:hypothetical protein|uniref:hypothetical protein n=1 Tax=Ensifer sp. TaxID=1872086 RepID=UPI002E0F362A|nr:hypothetical protein [Ensifer sp.]
MRITAIVEALVQSGASPEMILSAVKAAEAGQQLEAERRRASDRDRQRRHRARVTSRDVTVTAFDVLSDKESSPTPPKETNSPDPTPSGAPGEAGDLFDGDRDQVPGAASRCGGRRATRLPEGFEPDWDFAAKAGFSRAGAGVEFDKFCDYWRAKSGRDATKLDWAATWRNWMRNAGRPRRAARPHRSQRGQAPPRETAFARHQRECRQAIEQELHGNENNDLFRDDDLAGRGPAFDLEPGDYRAH